MSSDINLKPYTKARRNPLSRAGKSGDIATKELILHSSEHPKLDYTAREEDAGGVDSLLKHYVGVYDPETGKMEIIEARKMVVRGSVRAHQATAQDDISMVSLQIWSFRARCIIGILGYEGTSKCPGANLWY